MSKEERERNYYFYFPPKGKYKTNSKEYIFHRTVDIDENWSLILPVNNRPGFQHKKCWENKKHFSLYCWGCLEDVPKEIYCHNLVLFYTNLEKL